MIQFRLTVIAFALSLTLLGCGVSKTVTVPGGKATVTEENGTTTTDYEDAEGNKVTTKSDGEDYKSTVTDADGTETTVEGSADGDFADTGLTPYPITFKVDGKTIVNKAKQAGMIAVTAVAFTEDDPNKVFNHFREQLDKVESEVNNDSTRMLYGRKDGREVSVSITKADKGYQIYCSSYLQDEQ